MKYFLTSFLTALVLLFSAGCANNTPDGSTDHGSSVHNSTDHESDNHESSDHESETGEHHDGHDSGERHSDPSVIIVKKQPFSAVIKTGGKILVDSKDIKIITAKASGIVYFSDDFLFPGVKVNRNQTLFTVAGNQLADDNTELNYKQIRSDLDKAALNYERAQKLISEKIITEEHFLSAKNEYEKVLNEFNNLNATSGKYGNNISSPSDGYIKEIYVTEGQKVSSGQPVARIVTEHNLVLRADISPDNIDILTSVDQANFTVGYSKKVYKTSEMNGRKISHGKSTGENSFYIPVYFRMNYDPSLIEGTFAEVYLIGKTINDVIVIPNTSLMEEYGKYYVFIADEDGDYIKRYIETGYDNGESTMVISGLQENESIVVSDTYLIKLSQMSATVPSHNHNH